MPIEFEPRKRWVKLGTGDVYIVPVTEKDNCCYLVLVQGERGPITPLGISEERALVAGGTEVPENSILFESQSIDSLNVLIRGLEELRNETESRRHEENDPWH